jgi:hypothetical protein
MKHQVRLFDHFYPGAIDNRHVILWFLNEQDFLNVYLHPRWNFSGRSMMVSRWSPYFHPDKQSPCIPVWLGFPLLRAHLHSPSALTSIASAVGKVLKLHDNVCNFT